MKPWPMGRARMPSLAPNVPLIFPTRTSWMLNCKLFSGVCNYHVHHIYLPLSGVFLGTTFPLGAVEGFANCNGASSCQKLILSTIWEAKTAGLFDLHKNSQKIISVPRWTVSVPPSQLLLLRLLDLQLRSPPPGSGSVCFGFFNI